MKRSKTKGFSLIEVLAALAIFGIVSAAAYTVMISSMQHNSDNRVRTQALASTDTWLDRFRAKSLAFSYFTSKQSYGYGYDYSADSIISNAADPNKGQINGEWQPFKFEVQTVSFLTNPAIWQVNIRAYYKEAGGEEGHVDISTLVQQ